MSNTAFVTASGARSGSAAAVAGVLLAFLAGPSTGELSAASVFMKNGYIIQAPVVERSDAAIILGWPNGRVTLQRRFIDTVAYEAGEEKRLQEEESLSAQGKSTGEGELNLLASSNDSEELPPNLDDLMKRYAAGRAAENGSGAGAGEDPGALGAAPAPPGSGGPGGSPAGTVALVPRPEDLLAESVSNPKIAVSLRPPKGWTAWSNQEAFQVSGTAGPDGFRPSINVVAIDKGPLGLEEYGRFLKEEIASTLKDFEVLSEGHKEIGRNRAYELVVRGSYQERAAVLRQLLVAKGGRLWLVSAFTQDRNPSSGLLAIDESIKTLEFVER